MCPAALPLYISFEEIHDSVCLGDHLKEENPSLTDELLDLAIARNGKAASLQAMRAFVDAS